MLGKESALLGGGSGSRVAKLTVGGRPKQVDSKPITTFSSTLSCRDHV